MAKDSLTHERKLSGWNRFYVDEYVPHTDRQRCRVEGPLYDAMSVGPFTFFDTNGLTETAWACWDGRVYIQLQI